MTHTAKGTFDVALTPGQVELDGAVNRFDFIKTFYGGLTGAGKGVMLASGDPQTGSGGYVAIETVDGQLGDRRGGFALQQLGRNAQRLADIGLRGGSWIGPRRA